jgi:hypothetical protein
MNDPDLVTQYLAHAETSTRDGTDARWRAAAEELDSRITDDPERAWPALCEIIGRISADDILAYVAAGPLEALLARHPHRFIERVETLAKQDPHFRRAVSAVWGWETIPPEIRRRLDELLGDEPRL